MIPLSAKRRSELRAEAHGLSPIVLIGDKGLTDEVVTEIDRSLKAHELIKVRASAAPREQRDIWLEAICERLQAHPVQQIGKIFVIYRENVESDPAPAKAGGRATEVAARPPARRLPSGLLTGRRAEEGCALFSKGIELRAAFRRVGAEVDADLPGAAVQLQRAADEPDYLSGITI